MAFVCALLIASDITTISAFHIWSARLFSGGKSAPACIDHVAGVTRWKIASSHRLVRVFSSEHDDDDDDDYPIDVDTANFSPPKMMSFGPGRGRSAPSHRKAVGKSGSSSTSVHVCTNCGAEFVKWMGRCPTCKEWNSIQEFRVDRGDSGIGKGAKNGKPKSRAVFQRENEFGELRPRAASWLGGVGVDVGAVNAYKPVRMTDVYKDMEINSDESGNFRPKEKRLRIPDDDELNNVMGGGIMPGSLTLLGGDPGVGKSTLLLQTAGVVASLSTPCRGIGMGMDDPSEAQDKHGPVLYVSGEENAMQIASRAARLGIHESELLLLCETDADFIAETVASYSPMEESSIDNTSDPRTVGSCTPPCLVIIDSIQTMICEAGGNSATGGVTQVRECVGVFLRLAKVTGTPIILVGHVTKSGGVAGPRTVEHMVDCVLYLEGDRGGSGGPNLRMLRAAKNRFGSSEEVGVYEMDGSTQGGGRLVPVSDPSSLFLSNRIDTADSDGCAITVVLEGLRPMTVEVQALVASSSAGGKSIGGRRTVDGISTARLLLILAVLQKRYGISFSRSDVYVNVVGGIRLSGGTRQGSESDLATTVALVSSLTSIAVRADTAFVGEVGLLGELRQVPSLEKRVNEARRMGFSRIITPRQGKRRRGTNRHSKFARGIEWIECDNLLDAISAGLVSKLSLTNGKGGPRLKMKRFQEDTLHSQKSGNIHTVIVDDEDY